MPAQTSLKRILKISPPKSPPPSFNVPKTILYIDELNKVRTFNTSVVIQEQPLAPKLASSLNFEGKLKTALAGQHSLIKLVKQ